ncbi:hypothetical protein AB1Y20_009942 [Prymnesium parvum]|uniref:Uncharacterized protein n=1 Tax=Prymnesium parvum TaxID=97485 RepID=A0AB34K3H6_PRYPA
MPPRVAKLPANVLFGGTAGGHRKLDAAVRSSLVNEGLLSVDPAHWILEVLPFLSPAEVTMRRPPDFRLCPRLRLGGRSGPRSGFRPLLPGPALLQPPPSPPY